MVYNIFKFNVVVGVSAQCAVVISTVFSNFVISQFISLGGLKKLRSTARGAQEGSVDRSCLPFCVLSEKVRVSFQ